MFGLLLPNSSGVVCHPENLLSHDTKTLDNTTGQNLKLRILYILVSWDPY